MKISITHYGNTTSFESERDDQDIGNTTSEMVRVSSLKAMMVSVGFHPSSVDDYFVGAEGEWFPDLEEKTEMTVYQRYLQRLLNRDDYYYQMFKRKTFQDQDGCSY